MIHNNVCNDNNSLPIDTACLTINNQREKEVALYSVVDECYLCDGLKWVDLSAESNITLKVTSKYATHIYYVIDNEQICNTTYSFKQHGQYGWNLTDNGCAPIYIIEEPYNAYLPIVAAFMVYFFITVLFATYSRILHSIKLFRTTARSQSEDDTDDNTLQRVDNSTSQEISKRSSRVQSLDTFRGIAVLLMIFVNNGGGQYTLFNHSPWNGITIADLVLPWFAWIIGFTLYRSIRTQLRLSTSRKQIILRSFKRMLKLVLLGLMINSLNYHKGVTLQTLRYPGILQLLGISYFVCSLLEIIFGNVQRNFQFGRLMVFEDILDGWMQWLIIIIITVSRTLIVSLVQIPGCPKGYIGPGGYHNHGQFQNCTGGVVGYVDRYVFGRHIYNSTHNSVYGQILPHDPEGLLNTIGAILIVFLGLQASKVVIYHHKFYPRIILWAFFTSLIAAILCNFSKENGVIPMNKKMMSLSYVLFSSSTAFFSWAILHYIVDNKKWWSGAPFIYAGTNPILLYCGHYLTHKVFPWYFRIPGTSTHSTELAMNLWTTSIWTIIAYYLYIKDIIITV